MPGMFRYIIFKIAFLIVLSPVFQHPNLSAQNLLPNGGFEALIDEECLSPIQGFKKLQFWYLLDATPDLFKRGCPFEELDFVYWDASIRAYEGDNYAGIWSRWNSNDTYFTEGIATSLTQPLEAGTTYEFKMAIWNQGTFQGLDGSVAGCELDPAKHIDLYISRDSIFVINDFAMGTASTTANLVASLDSEHITQDGGEDWTIVSTCFEAQGEENFFAIILPLGTFGALPECALTMATSGVFRSFYYNVDALSLTQLSASFEKEEIVCEDQPYTINLRETFQDAILDSAVFEWHDGFTGVSRTLDIIQDWQITAKVGCGSIPIEMNIIGKDCAIHYYVPNVFSPNNDGQNDEFQVFISDNIPVSDFELTIMDRWGNIFFQSADPNTSWNGRIGSEKASPGVYGWSFSFETVELNTSKRVSEAGGVLLIR